MPSQHSRPHNPVRLGHPCELTQLLWNWGLNPELTFLNPDPIMTIMILFCPSSKILPGSAPHPPRQELYFETSLGALETGAGAFLIGD